MLNDYEILGVQPNATWKDVKRAFKEQVKRWHPDRFPSEDTDLQKRAHKKFQKILDAYKRIESVLDNQNNIRYADDQSNPKFRHSQFQTEDDSTQSPKSDPESSPNSHFESEEAPGFYTRVWKNGDRYEGQMSNNMMHGMGIYTFNNGDRYTGQFKYNKPDGQGKMIYANGDSYSGGFQQDRMHGKGTYIYANGDRFMGYFKDDLPHGEGVHILASGQVYGGLWENGYLLS